MCIFLCMERCKHLAYWNHFFHRNSPIWGRYLAPWFSYIFSSSLATGSGGSWQLLDGRHCPPFWCPLGPEAHIWRSEIPDGCDILVYWYGRKALRYTLLNVVAFLSSCILDHSFLSIQVDESRHLACLCSICIPSAYNSNWQCIVAEVTLNEFTLFARIILYCFKQISEDSHVALFFFLAICKHFSKNLRTFSSVAILKWSSLRNFHW